jgi:hypothetical protein
MLPSPTLDVAKGNTVIVVSLARAFAGFRLRTGYCGSGMAEPSFLGSDAP